MKKRLLTLFLVATMVASMLATPAEAAPATFYDVNDDYTATAIETLRIMGVLDGYEDGSFRPEENLTRAQFCKMAIFAMDSAKELGQYNMMTIFPDVRSSHWASNYVNMAAKKGIVSGFTNGTFGPQLPVTTAQATAILLRMLGYKDAELGGIWPNSYMNKAEEIGLTNRTGVSDPNVPLTRGQAAIMFMNLLSVKDAKGGTLYELSDLVRLASVDGGRGIMTAGGKVYPMAKATASTTLKGLNGWVVMNDGRALTFLPAFDGSSGVTNAAVIIYADRDATGLTALTGNTNYHIYKNGIPASIADLRKDDVAIYSAATNSVLVCDTRVTAYYEDCSPSASAPEMIVALGTEFSVVPTAMDMLAKFKPGKTMTLLLTADGQIAGAIDGTRKSGSNAVGIVSDSGEVQMICGDKMIKLEESAADYYGQAVSLSSDRNGLKLSALNHGVSGDLDVARGMVGKKYLADNAKIYVGSEPVELGQLATSTVKQSKIVYARTNWNDEVDLIVLKGETKTDAMYGVVSAVSEPEWQWFNPESAKTEDPTEGVNGYYYWIIAIDCGEGTQLVGNSESKVSQGAYVAATMRDGDFSSIRTLTKIANVSGTSWIGTSAVVCNGRTYNVSKDTLCYNANRKKWMSLEETLAYTNSVNLYVQDQNVRIIEIKQ